MGQLFWFAYWLMPDPHHPDKVIKCIRGPKEDLPALNDEVSRIWQGHFEVVQLNTRDPDKAKGIIADKLASTEGLNNALGRVSWKTPKRVLT